MEVASGALGATEAVMAVADSAAGRVEVTAVAAPAAAPAVV
jgi:hypothetical protein